MPKYQVQTDQGTFEIEVAESEPSKPPQAAAPSFAHSFAQGTGLPQMFSPAPANQTPIEEMKGALSAVNPVSGPGPYEPGSLLNLVHAIPGIGPPLAKLGHGISTGDTSELGEGLGGATMGVLTAHGAAPGPEAGITPRLKLRSPVRLGKPIIPEMPGLVKRYVPGHEVMNAATDISRLRLQNPVEDFSFPSERNTPAWKGIPPVEAAAVPNISPIAPESGKLPSGRPLPKPEPQSRVPAWEGKTAAGSSPQPVIEPIPEVKLPSGRTPGAPDPFVGPVRPIEPVAPSVTNAEASAPTTRSVKHPPSHTDVNRQLHANAADLELPGSPAGKNGHAAISKAAKKVFGVDSTADLTYEQSFILNEFLLQNKRLPTSVADLKSGLK